MADSQPNCAASRKQQPRKRVGLYRGYVRSVDTVTSAGIVLRERGSGFGPGFSKDRLMYNGWQFRIGKKWFAVGECQCGRTVVVAAPSVVSDYKSCGCLKSELSAERLVRHNRATAFAGTTTHGLSRTRMHSVWRGMIDRCTNAKCTSYHRYGGRGVSVCDEWRASFVAFHSWAMANGYEDHLSIDRIDSNGNYEPSNCRWVTVQVNSALARVKHARYLDTEIPEDVSTSFDKTLAPGRGGKHRTRKLKSKKI